MSHIALAPDDRRRAMQQRVQIRPRQVATIHHDGRDVFRVLDIFEQVRAVSGPSMPTYVARDVGDPSTIVPLTTLRGPSVSARSTEPRNTTISVAGTTAPGSRIPVKPLATFGNADHSHRSSE